MNCNSKHIQRNGFTLVEVVAVIATVGVVTLGTGVLLANNQQSWGNLFDRVYGDPTTGGYSAQSAFDKVCRKASNRKYALSLSGDSLELYYWNVSSTSQTPENYAHFYQDGDQMLVEYGNNLAGTWQPDTGGITTTVTLASNVSSLKFTVEGTSIQMYLTYLDADMLPVVCSSVRHNN